MAISLIWNKIEIENLPYMQWYIKQHEVSRSLT